MRGSNDTVAVVLAGGIGSRAGLGHPKQFAVLAGRTLLERTVARFERSEAVDGILVLIAPDHIDRAERILKEAGFAKIAGVVPGGEQRSDSTRAALDRIAADGGAAKVLVHDAARPFVPDRVIREAVGALDDRDAVNVVDPVTDTLVTVRDDGEGGEAPAEVVDRSAVRRVQTPQGFRFPVLAEAYRLAAGDPDFRATDDCSVVMRYLPEARIAVIAGDPWNMKVTGPADVLVADLIAARLDETGTGALGGESE
ncbi:IspD/TarI family cytidylyltransferase [Salininema proteolyticum]|uniref:2-C-methyl-D-erythritol 4-phosphate cytidylyltransferase n=1 Tax=Salininema proteolyticum TaxID=1607685 RepID=A0ABV8U279_9ACTN